MKKGSVYYKLGSNQGVNTVNGSDAIASVIQAPPALGINTYTPLESGCTGATFFGTSGSMLMTAAWRG